MTWAKIRGNSLIFRGATEHLKNMKMDRFGCFPRKLKIVQEIVYENIYFQKNKIHLLLTSLRTKNTQKKVQELGRKLVFTLQLDLWSPQS